MLKIQQLMASPRDTLQICAKIIHKIFNYMHAYVHMYIIIYINKYIYIHVERERARNMC